MYFLLGMFLSSLWNPPTMKDHFSSFLSTPSRHKLLGKMSMPSQLASWLAGYLHQQFNSVENYEFARSTKRRDRKGGRDGKEGRSSTRLNLDKEKFAHGLPLVPSNGSNVNGTTMNRGILLISLSYHSRPIFHVRTVNGDYNYSKLVFCRVIGLFTCTSWLFSS